MVKDEEDDDYGELHRAVKSQNVEEFKRVLEIKGLEELTALNLN